MRLFVLLLCGVLASGLPATAQMTGKDLDGVTIKSKKLTARAILDSIYANARHNYAEPVAVSGTFTASYTRDTDTAFFAQVPVYLQKKEDFTYSWLLWDTTDRGILQDQIQSKAQWDRVFTIPDGPFPSRSNVMDFIHRLYNINDTKRVLYASDGSEEDPHFYLLFRPKGKIHLPLVIRPFISSLSPDSLFSYSLLKIRRKGWVVTAHESALLLADPAQLQELIATRSYTRALELIAAAKAQPSLRRNVHRKEWLPGPDGRYRIHRSVDSDNLFNVSLALFKRFPDPEGYLGTSEVIYAYEKPIPEKTQILTLMQLLRDRNQYPK